MIKVLFVCLGNICRSPMAEGIFKRIIEDNNLESNLFCDSAGTSNYHIGEPPDKRMRETAEKYGIRLNHLGRQLTEKDFNDFDYIFAMDSSNMQNIKLVEGNVDTPKAKVFMMRYFDPSNKNDDVPDPYYGGIHGFDNVYNILNLSLNNFFEYIKEEHNL